MRRRRWPISSRPPAWPPRIRCLYKHFSSKRALLEAAITSRIEKIVTAREEYDSGEPQGMVASVRMAGRLIWSNLTESEELLRVMLREPDELGDLDEKTCRSSPTTRINVSPTSSPG